MTTPNQNKLKAEKLMLPAKQVNMTASKANNPGFSNSNQLSQQKKKKKQQVALVHSLPKNIEEQWLKFIESDCKYNPQFEYENHSMA